MSRNLRHLWKILTYYVLFSCRINMHILLVQVSDGFSGLWPPENLQVLYPTSMTDPSSWRKVHLGVKNKTLCCYLPVEQLSGIAISCADPNVHLYFVMLSNVLKCFVYFNQMYCICKVSPTIWICFLLTFLHHVSSGCFAFASVISALLVIGIYS